VSELGTAIALIWAILFLGFVCFCLIVSFWWHVDRRDAEAEYARRRQDDQDRRAR